MTGAEPLHRTPLGIAAAVLVPGMGVAGLVGGYVGVEAGGWKVFGMLALIALAAGFAAYRTALRVRRSLADSERRFRDLAELSADWWWEQDAQFRFTRMSGGALNKGGFRIDESIGRTRWELPIYEPDAELWRRHREQLERHEPFHDLRYRIKVADGTVHSYSVSGRPRFDAQGRFAGYRGIGHDITDAAAAEEALRQSESQLRLIADSMPAMFAYFRAGRICEYCNSRYAAFFGYTPEQARGRPLSDIIGAATMAELEVSWQRVESGVTVNYERHARDRAGRAAYIDVWLVPQTDARGEVAGVYAMVNDITARKETELKLRLAATVFESSLEGVTITDAEGTIVSVNQSFSRITGYGADEVIGRNPRILQSGRQNAAFYAAMWLALTQGGAWSGEIWNKRKSGEIYPEILSITAVRDEQGRPLHYIGVFTDISDLKRAEDAVRAANADLERRVRERTAELEASNRELEAFSYSVSHDLRGPLRGIEGFAHVIGEDYAGCLGEEGRGHLARIRKAAQHMAQLIDDMLELARITRADMHRREVDLSALAHAAVRDLQKEAGRRAVFHIEPGLKAWADPTLVATLLDHLFDNAWKFTARQAEARIELSARLENGERTFFVRDNGAGFDPAYADKLFQPFQRLHHPDEFVGTGIGLATASRIVRRHGGRIWAEGRPGGGATFYFTLS